MKLLDDILPAARFIESWLEELRPQTAIILGSGLSAVTERMADVHSLAYEELPGFPAVGVAGHGGRVFAGLFNGLPVLMFAGRYHYYEGYDAWQVTAPVRLAAELGCERIVLTNAAGGIDDRMTPGDFMLVSDHLNLMGINPLRGRPDREFLDLGNLYDRDFYPRLREALSSSGIQLHQGTLAWMTGPSYETPAEIQALERLGAAAVSMSTIPEAIIARSRRMHVAAVSLIANYAAGKQPGALEHDEVLAVGLKAAETFELLLEKLFHFWSAPCS